MPATGDDSTNQLFPRMPGLDMTAQQNVLAPPHNHVIFDANTIDILRKYGIAGLIAGGGATAAGSQQPPMAQ